MEFPPPEPANDNHPTIDRIIAGARRNGALAGKVCGAGGGGCVALLIEPDARPRVEAATDEVGIIIIIMTRVSMI